MLSDHIGGQRRLVVVVEIGPIQREHNLLAAAQDEGGPGLEQSPNVVGRIAREAINLLDAMLGHGSGQLGVALSDRMDT